MAITFQPVDDSRRTARGTRSKPSPFVEALLAGQTLLVATEKTEDGKEKVFSSGWTNRILNKHGMRCRTTKQSDGTVVWAEPIETTTETTEAVAAPVAEAKSTKA